MTSAPVARQRGERVDGFVAERGRCPACDAGLAIVLWRAPSHYGRFYAATGRPRGAAFVLRSSSERMAATRVKRPDLPLKSTEHCSGKGTLLNRWPPGLVAGSDKRQYGRERRGEDKGGRRDRGYSEGRSPSRCGSFERSETSPCVAQGRKTPVQYNPTEEENKTMIFRLFSVRYEMSSFSQHHTLRQFLSQNITP